ncbi:MAG: SPASM domain-containing protein [Candidatus Cloacimonetes bacterium]|nr:SPASM domain-containing protein [Candidatus Cloacimonadota bacterium]MCF7812850.1 SPASM domain-containing protein [Candidatus Cloacimonadota bacterium]MCF7867062.1 SPASM domain-containing protein [Candidatus Cloacimonadota bacterium]MCF7882618.1 SPASM domain-containing protein [Candidatus Cloacimonadota bacterium]
MLKENIRFVRKSFTFRRFINVIKVYFSYLLSLIFRRAFYWGFPPIIMIEPTNVCNLKCPLCPTGNDTLKRQKGFMSFDVFKKIIDEVHKKSLMVVLWNQGEPYLNIEFNKMVKYASDHDLFTLVSTNGNLDIDGEDIVNSGLDSMIISLDGTNQKTYNKYRVNGKLENVLNNVKKIVTARKKLRRNNPILRWQFLVMKHNEHELDEIKRMAAALEVDNLELKSIQIYSKEDVHNFLPKNPKYRRYKVKGEDFELKYGIKNQCRRIWTNAVVNWNGDVAICCFDKEGEFKIGNVKDEKLEKLWKSKSIMKIRNQILKDRKQIPVCRNCLEGVSIKLEETKV